MKSQEVIEALGLPSASRVDQRIPKKLLIDNGAPTPSDKRTINEAIEDVRWLAALRPGSLGIAAYKDDVREYLEIAVLEVSCRQGASVEKLAQLIHRAIPYPILLIQSQAMGTVLSLSHLRWSQAESGKTVLDGGVLMAELTKLGDLELNFIDSLQVGRNTKGNLFEFYQSWIDRIEAYAASAVTGVYETAIDSGRSAIRREALADYERITREIAQLRQLASRERQVSRRVEANLKLKQLESLLAQASAKM
jgi:hypothetical protein